MDGGVFAGGLDLLQATGLILDDDGGGNKLGLFVEECRIVEGADGVTRRSRCRSCFRARSTGTDLQFQHRKRQRGGRRRLYRDRRHGDLPAGQTLAAAFCADHWRWLLEPSRTFTLTVTPTAEIANGSDGATGTVTIVDGNVAGRSMASL